jgi:acylphosphatase
MKTVRLLIRGRVQGVGFRNYCRSTASLFGLYGYVKNLKDGRVEVVLQGEGGCIEEFIDRILYQSPGYVRNVKTIWKNYRKKFKDFQIY